MTGEDGVSLANMNAFDSGVNQIYETRYATAAHDELAGVTPDEIRTTVRNYENAFGGRKNILASIQRLAMFARSSSDPEAIVAAITRDAEDFLQDEPTEKNDGTWLDVRTMRDYTAGTPVANIAGLLWEKTASKYKNLHGDIPRTAEEKQALEEAKERAKTAKVI